MKLEILTTELATCGVCGKDSGECAVLVLTPVGNVGICVTISVCQSCWAKTLRKFKGDKK